MADNETHQDTWRSGRLRPGTTALAATCWLAAAVAGPLAWASTLLAAGEPSWHVVVNALVLIGPATVGAVLASRLPRNPVGWLLLLTPMAVALSHLAQWYAAFATAAWGVWAAWFGAVMWAFGPPLLPLLGLLFPDGRPLGRVGWWGVRAAIGAVGLVILTSALAPGPLAALSDSPGPINPMGLALLAPVVPSLAAAAAALLTGAAAAAMFTLVRRWARGQIGDRLALTAAGTPLVIALVLTVAAQVFGVGGTQVAVAAAVIAAVGVPAGIGLAVTRYRLYAGDLAVTGALALTLVAAILTGVYAAAATLAGLEVGRDSPVAVAIATSATAAAFAPLHSRIRRCVQRRVLGLAGDPERAAVTVARRLESVEDPDQIATAAGAAVSELLRLPHTVVLPPGQPDVPRGLVCVPLTHHGIGLGVLATRGPLAGSERRALTRSAQPIAAALHAAALSDAVRRSRADLVAAVEEERRRLRRDLHDGLGPGLATLSMGLDAIGNRAVGTSAEVVLAPVVARLRTQADEMLADLRRIVSGLRPPALDEFGLVEAVRMQAAEVAQPTGLFVDVVADGDLGPLPAAVEVAAYRIAVEAILNAVRHSGGQRCHVEIRREDGLRLAVLDDGGGVSSRGPVGVGLQSMRERAAGVGGWVVVLAVSPHGTEVRAWLPAVA